MSDHTVVDAASVDPAMGRFRKMRLALGTNAFGINQIELPPGSQGPEHDEAGTAHEEVYVVLKGAGVLSIGGQDVELLPGRYVRVAPQVSRQVTAGDEGLVFIAIGAPIRDDWTGRPTL